MHDGWLWLCWCRVKRAGAPGWRGREAVSGWGRAKGPSSSEEVRPLQAKALARAHLKVQELLVEVEDLLEMYASQGSTDAPERGEGAW